MITDLLIYAAALVLKVFATILPNFQLWPDTLITGLNYLSDKVMNLNFIFPIDTLYTAIRFYVAYEVAYYTAQGLASVFNFFRGTGKGIDV